MLSEIRRHISGLGLEKPAEVRLIAEPELEGNLLEALSSIGDFTLCFENEARVQNTGKRNIELLMQDFVQPFGCNTEGRSVELCMAFLAEMFFDHLEKKAHALAVLVE